MKPKSELRQKFESLARNKGYTNFQRRGDFYSLSELNTLWDGFMLAH